MPLRSSVVHGDVCIVGSGFAGVAAAERLATSGAAVIVLDAGFDGGRPPAPVPTVRVEGDADFDVDDNRVVGVGGTSAKWNGVATRPEPATVAEWPIPTGELSRYFDQAEQWLGVAGAPPRQGAEPPRSDTLRPASTTLLPEHLPSLARFDPVVLPFAFVAGGPRRLAEHDVPRMLATGAALRTGTSVRSVEPARRGATTVHVVDAEGHAGVVRARRVVLACGVVETIRILAMSTGRRNRVGVGNLAGRLGRGVNAHPRRRATIHRAPELDGRRGVLRSYRVGDEFAAAGLGRVLLDVNYMEPIPMIDVTVEQEAAAGNSIRLGADGDLHARLTLSARDHATIAAADRLIADVAMTLPGAGTLSPPVTRWFHPAGGCAMAETAATGVVDPHGQVFGVPGVYVAGAATFPTSGAGNPTLTVVALALRLADHLRTLG